MVLDRLDAIRAFQRVVETGSFSAVAREKGVAQPTISKLVAALEAHLKQDHTKKLLDALGPLTDGEIKAKVYVVPD